MADRIHVGALAQPRQSRTARRTQARRAQRSREQLASDLDTTDRRTDQPLLEPGELLPRGGEAGPQQLRSYGRLRVPAHQDTSAALRGAYPMLAEGGLGGEGVFGGHDLLSGGAFALDPWLLYRRGIITSPNMILTGVVGAGKSALAKSLYTRSIAFGRKVYVPGDPKGEHTAIARLVGGQAIVLGRGLRTRLNPLDAGPKPSTMDQTEWRAAFTARRRDLLGALAETSLGRPLSPVEHTAIDIALQAASAAAAVPTLPAVVDQILAPDRGADERIADDGRQVGHALRRLVAGDLKGLVDGPSTEAIDPDRPMVSLDLSRIGDNGVLLSVLMACSSAWMESALLDPAGGQRWVVYDEAWRLISHPALLRRMDTQVRLARHYGIANLVILHRLTDLEIVGNSGGAEQALASSLLALADTRIVYRQESDQLGSTAQALGLSRTERTLLPNLGVGQGLWRIGGRSFLVQHRLAAAEAAAFDTNQRMFEIPRGFTNREP